ncbi:cytidyltransferase-like protein [Paraburkholderia sp. WC7.3g]|uniref:adenylyltransferase/cytidyltransferase family protein n=1 Tax=Paraburkholderia sp. WC7.3g TaxID=2991070 RepID=UPI003D2019B5
MQTKLFPQGCVHGRFQPPHLDHLKYIRAALAKVEHLIIGIAQPDAPYLDDCEADPHRSQKADNPLTYVERCVAMERMLTGEGVSRDKFSFSRFPIDRPDELLDIIPCSVVCFTTIRDDWNRKKIEILRQHGYDVKVLWESAVQGISGTKIRQKMRSSDAAWEESVHPAVAGYLNSEHLVDRIKLG